MADPPATDPAAAAAALTEDEASKWEQALAGILSQPGRTTPEGAAVLPWLLLGGKHAAADASGANTQEVTHVLNVSEPWSAEGPNRDSLVSVIGFFSFNQYKHTWVLDQQDCC